MTKYTEMKLPENYAVIEAEEMEYLTGGATLESVMNVFSGTSRVFNYIGRVFYAIGTLFSSVYTLYTSSVTLKGYLADLNG